MAKSTKSVNASVLSFDRKIDPSDALMSSCVWGDWLNCETVPVREKTVRGVISNIAKMTSASVESTNIQTIDVSDLPHDADTLRVRFTLRVLGNVAVPSSCNNVDYQSKLESTVSAYLPASLAELSQRYASNIANARFLWRNRISAEEIYVRVSQLKSGQTVDYWEFLAKEHSVNKFEKDTSIEGLAKAIESGLSGDYTLFEVSAYARMGAGQQVFPSEEMIMNKDSKKSKTLYSVDNCAAMHSQKIGNALRTVDTWYPRNQGEFGPIAVEPFGQITARGIALRQANQKADFYTLLDAMMSDQDISENDRHFVVANLIRGGVFGRSSK